MTVEAKKKISAGFNAFDVLRGTVFVKYKTFPKLGPMVTSLCGVEAPDGVFWTLYVNGKFSEVGIGDLKLENDTTIEWKTQKIEKRR